VWQALFLIAVVGCGRVGFDSQTRGDGAVPGEDARADADVSGLLAGCELWLAFDDPTSWPTGIRDRCGDDNPGTANGGASPVDDADRGAVAELAGASSCIVVPDAPNLRGGSALTISAWVRPVGVTTASYGIISKRTDFMSNTAYSMFLWASSDGTGSVNHLYVDIENEDQRFEDPGPEFLGTWRQITVVYDGNLAQAQRVSIYVDGALSAVAAEAATNIAVPTSPPAVHVGCMPLGTPAQGLIGRIDDAMLWSRPLTATEVMAWYAATRP